MDNCDRLCCLIDKQKLNNLKINWQKEEEKYDFLLQDIEEWSKQKWTKEEQKKWQQAINNL